jgi:hypothetical protein
VKKKIAIIAVMAGLVACNLYFGVSWLAVRNDLRTVREANEQLAQENRQHSAAVQEADSRLATANEQLESASAKVTNLADNLAESQRFGEYWWERGHPREFQSLEELKAWLVVDDTDSTVYIFGAGCLDCYDCDDYAVALMRNALKDGYLISMQFEKNHALNSTIIGNSVYSIEPQNDEVRFMGNRDCNGGFCEREAK